MSLRSTSPVYNLPTNDDAGRGGSWRSDSCAPFLLGRTAFNYLIHTAGVRRVCLPAYVCPILVDICLHHGCEVLLYDHLDAGLRVSEEAIMASLPSQARPGTFLLWVDYWGLGREIPEAIYAACEGAGIVTIVDAAHALPGRNYRADYVIYGARKLLQSPFGALLFAREHQSLPVAPSMRGAWPWLLAAEYHARTTLCSRFTLNLRRWQQRLWGRVLSVECEQVLTFAEYGYRPLLQKLAKLDIDALAARRRKHYAHLSNALGAALSAEETSCPMGFPYLSDSRDDLRRYLWHEGIYTSTIWDRLHPLAQEQNHRNALALARRILTLPVNHDLSDEQVDRVVRLVTAFSRNNGVSRLQLPAAAPESGG